MERYGATSDGGPPARRNRKASIAWREVTAGERVSALHRRTSGEHLRADLNEALAEQQLRTFTRWWNSWLSQVELHVSSLIDDVKPGVLPIRLLEVHRGAARSARAASAFRAH